MRAIHEAEAIKMGERSEICPCFMCMKMSEEHFNSAMGEGSYYKNRGKKLMAISEVLAIQ